MNGDLLLNRYLKHLVDKKKELEDEEALIAVLVNKLGGSVTITDKELSEYEADLIIERVASGRMATKIRVK